LILRITYTTLICYLQVVFEGIRGYGYLGDIAIDDVNMVPGACAGVGTCDFESDLCGWTQRTDDTFDWLRRSGGTPSVNTGPTVDHTLGTTTGKNNTVKSCIKYLLDI